MRSFQGRTRAETAFEQHKVLETLHQIPEAVDKLGPRLEGRALQDIDDLVDYTRNAVQGLPSTLSDKVIGKIQTPLHYERSFLRDIRGKLDDILRDAERFETTHLDRTLRNTLIILALWEIMTVCLVLAVAAGGFGGVSTQLGSVFVIFAVGIVMVIVGL